MKTSATLAILLLLLPIQQLFAQDPFIAKYDAIKRSERCFTLTEDENYQLGAVWLREKIDFSHDTTFRFATYLGNKDASGADGIAFVMHNDPQDTIVDKSQTWTKDGRDYYIDGAIGNASGGLGYGDHSSTAGQPLDHIAPSIAIELDTWNSSDTQDGKSGQGWGQSPYYGWDHTAVVYNGNMYTEQQVIYDNQGNSDRILPLLPIYSNDGNTMLGENRNIEDNNCYTFEIHWKVNSSSSQTLELWQINSDETDDLTLVMTHTDNMLQDVFDGTSLLRVGFTGSTGGTKNEQTICLLGDNIAPVAEDDHVTTRVNTPVVIDVASNDNDPDGDALQIPSIVQTATHGTAVIFDSLGTDYLRYTPNKDYIGSDIVIYQACDINSTKCYAKCDMATVYINVSCEAFDINAVQTSPNIKCIDAVPDNGAAEVFGAPTTAKYEWFHGTVDDTPDYTGSTISGIPHGSYQVIATDTLTGCTSSIASVTIDSVGKPVPTVVVTPNTSCHTPNGQLEITEVNDNADALSDYTFEWLFGADRVIGNTALITALDSGDYQLNITDNETDCVNELTYEVASDKDCSEESVITSSKYFPGDIQLFPNPANTTIQLKGLTKDSDYTIRIYALTGDKVLETKAQSIDISALDKGVYILTVYQKNEAIQSLRWIKE